MINFQEIIISERDKILKEEKINKKIFFSIKEMREKYLEWLKGILPLYKQDINNHLGLSDKDREKKIKNIILCIRGSLKDLLGSIKKRYSKKLRIRIKKC